MPTEGFVEVLGFDSLRNRRRIHRLVGYLPHEPLLYRDLTGIENLHFYSRFYTPLSGGWQERIDELLEILKIKRWCYELVKNCQVGFGKGLTLLESSFTIPN
jgi:heme exporter protein A